MNTFSKKYVVVLLASLFFVQAQAQEGTAAPGITIVTEGQVQAVEDSNSSTRLRSSTSNGGSVVEVKQGSPQVVIQSVPTQTVRQQPTTVVEASAIAESRAEQMRRARQDVEILTEQKIVEKLEASRLEDEKSRIQKMFGGSEQQATQTVPTYNSQQVPAVQVVPVQQPVQAQPSQNIENVKQEIIEAIREDRKDEEQREDAVQTAAKVSLMDHFRHSKYFVAGAIGTANYVDADNIDAKLAWGLTAGMLLPSRFTVEASFMYSSYYLQDFFWATGAGPIFRELDQYSFGFGTKYAFFTGAFKPFVGAGLNYTYRRYTDQAFVGTCGPCGGVYVAPNSSATSYAFDVGFSAGIDLEVAYNFGLGFQWSYYTNLGFSTQSDILSRYGRPPGTSLVEESDYSTLGFYGRYSF